MLQWLLLLCVLIFTGCATGLKQTDDGELVPEKQPMIDVPTGPFAIVKVESHNLNNIKVYVLRGNTKFRIGLVGTGNSILKLQSGNVDSDGNVTFLLEVMAAEDEDVWVVPAVRVERGDVVHLNVESLLSTSSSVVWNDRK